MMLQSALSVDDPEKEEWRLLYCKKQKTRIAEFPLTKTN